MKGVIYSPLPPLAVQNKIADEVKKRMQKAEQLQKEAKELLLESWGIKNKLEQISRKKRFLENGLLE